MVACPSLEILNQANVTLSLYWGPDKAVLYCVLQFEWEASHSTSLTSRVDLGGGRSASSQSLPGGSRSLLLYGTAVGGNSKAQTDFLLNFPPFRSLHDMLQTCFLPGQYGSITSFFCTYASLTQLSFCESLIFGSFTQVCNAL